MPLAPWAVAIAGLTLLAGTGAAVSKSPAGERTVVIRTPRGATRAQFEISEPGGVIRLYRVVAPAGSRLTVTAIAPGIAGLRTSAPGARNDPSESCTERYGSLDCTQGEEWCPMPPARWQIRLRKLAGPGGPIRISFVVGPARTSAPPSHARPASR